MMRAATLRAATAILSLLAFAGTGTRAADAPAATAAATATAPAPAPPRLTLCCGPGNDLYAALGGAAAGPPRYADPAEAVARASDGSAVLVLADQYPVERTRLDPAAYAAADRKRLRLYVEFPVAIPGVAFGEPRRAEWERLVVTSDAPGLSLPPLRILGAHACTFLPTATPVTDPTIVLARVAGFDTAVYGLPKQTHPVLFAAREGRWLVATTALSNFRTGRYAPARDWTAVWAYILGRLDPGGVHELRWRPDVRPAYGPADPLPADAEAAACRAAANWYLNAGLLVHPDREPAVHRLLAAGAETVVPATGGPTDGPPGDGSRGMLEGFASTILPDGTQPVRLPIRADCNAEAAMVLALDGWRGGDEGAGDAPRRRAVAANLLDYVHHNAPSRRGPRGDPAHPAFGLIAWGEVAPAWTAGNYGDDNARAVLATLAAAAALGTDRYDRPVLRALLANRRTTGRLGFRGDRLDVPQLERLGWRHFADAATVNHSPHFESGLWACYLWAHARTVEPGFLDTAAVGIRSTMAAYPAGWRWQDNMERARMLLCLAWLVRVHDTPEHRGWLAAVAGDLLESQQPSGAIRERLGRAGGGGHYVVPASNAAYGTTETPLQQTPGDPVTDQLYTTGFALLGLHEAAAATGDPELRRAADLLAGYLCRVQVRSARRPELDGAWLRAFDDRAWEYWASSADAGWGAWSAEAGWGPAWAAATLALRERRTSLWELTAGSGVRQELGAVRAEMARNDGSPLKR